MRQAIRWQRQQIWVTLAMVGAGWSLHFLCRPDGWPRPPRVFWLTWRMRRERPEGSWDLNSRSGLSVPHYLRSPASPIRAAAPRHPLTSSLSLSRHHTGGPAASSAPSRAPEGVSVGRERRPRPQSLLFPRPLLMIPPPGP